MFELKIEKVKRSYCIMAGVAILAKFRTEQLAQDSLNEKREHWEYWSKSSSVSFQNKRAQFVYI
jgi:hypothetical protein